MGKANRRRKRIQQKFDKEFESAGKVIKVRDKYVVGLDSDFKEVGLRTYFFRIKRNDEY